MKNKLPVLEAELSYELQGVFMAISKEYSYLFKEKVYYNILKEKLLKNNLKFVCQPCVNLFSSETKRIVGSYFPDFLVEDKILVEIKAQTNILDTHVNQLIRYLKMSKYEIGYLVNFGCPRAQITRRIYTNDKKSFIQLNTNKHE